MAQATPSFVTPKQPKPEQTGVVLTLSMNEAYAVATALSHIGGSRNYSGTKHATNVLKALEYAGVYWNKSPFRAKFVNDSKGEHGFVNYWGFKAQDHKSKELK